MSEKKSHEEIVRELENISPMALPRYIAECEFYDMTSSRQILDEAIAEFEKDGGAKDAILKPVILSVADGLIEALPNTRQLRRKGLTPQRIYNECEAFSYEEPLAPPLLDTAYVDYKNARDFLPHGKEAIDVYRGGFSRDKYGNNAAMNKYKDAKVKANGSAKNLTDEYTGQKNITAYKDNADLRRNDPTHRYQAQTDHIVPLHNLYLQYGGNYALSDNDIRIIANQDYNFALTSGKINQTKLDSTNSEYVKKNKDNLDPATRKIMLEKEKEAQAALNSKTNKVVGNNLMFNGTVSSSEAKKAYVEFTEKNGRKPTAAEKNAIKQDLQKQKTLAVHGKLVGNAANQAMNCAVGNVVMFVLKPLYYEIKDTFINGFKDGVNASSGIEAIRIRFGRVKDYVIKNVASFIGDNLWDFIKGLVSSLIEGIISLFVGIFKQILKIIKEGIRIFIQSAKILWGKDSVSMTPAEKGDAIIKLIGGSVMALAGIGIEALLNRIGIGDPWSTVLATMLSGIASALFMYLLDKADLFSVKAEKREQRIKEIFELRKKDLLEDTRHFDAAVRATMRKQRIAYEQLQMSMDSALEEKDFDKTSQVLNDFAEFFQVTIPYGDTQSFIKYVKSNEVITIA
ncbi:MAG: DNA repair protein [Lentisphaeria bacterium]|nr:DNA repair protein [Lentisphaeria bacterium]